MRNIAQELNISISTVSFVLNGKSKEKHISEQMTNKVLNYAKLVNYRPNQIAQSLRTGQSKILVFMVEDISNNFYCRLARIFEEIIYDKGYKVIFCSNNNNDGKSRELIDLFANRQVDGFIITPSPGIKDAIENLIQQNIPVILLERFFEYLECDLVAINNKEAAFEATLHLIDNEFKNIAFVSTASEQTHMRDRLSGYKDAMSVFGLQPNLLLISDTETQQLQKDRIEKFMTENNHLDAVFFGANHLTQIGLEVLKESNFKLLDNPGLVSFGDNDSYKLYPVSISYISEPLPDIGFKLMELMLLLLKKREVSKFSQKVIFTAELVIGDSTCRVKKGPR